MSMKVPGISGCRHVSPDHASTCSMVGGEEKQQTRVRARLGTAGGIGKGERVSRLVLVLEKC